MHIGRKIALAGTVLALAVGTTQSATADPSSSAASANAPRAVSRSVTLLTGDRVVVSGTAAEKSSVSVFHPAGATSVSLRAKATDRGGNTVEQTVIRAYKLR